ncbi:MAG: T9SS type A sorting domain-containing protein [Flavobacterium sp.]|nr:T9SS type A sorting domain-containing protein [Flavobacterium sp.]
MKSKITLLFILTFALSGFSQDKVYNSLKSKTNTHILYDRVFGLSDATNLNTTSVSTNNFLQVYHEMQRADFDNRLPVLGTIQEESNLGFGHNQIPLSILITDFETIKKSEIDSKNVFINAFNQMEIKPNSYPFELHSLNLIGTLLQKSKNKQVEFILKSNLIFNTTNRVLNTVSISLNDSKNWKTIILDQAFKVNFSKNGTNILNFKITFSNGEYVTQSNVFEIDNTSLTTVNKNNSTQSVNVINTITATIPYQGYGETASFLGQGEYQIFPDTVDGILDKPIFLLDGFDPGDSRNIAAIYSLLNNGTSGGNLGDQLRAQGFDVVVLNFPTYTRPGTTTVIDGGVDYIQRNAMILVELINQINALKIGTTKNVVIGPSMGGLISRYALRYMEQNSLNPDTRLYISFDSPHLGANVPIGFQHLFNYMAYGPLGNVSVQTIVNGMLKSPAGREMLLDHFEGHLQTGSATEFNTSPNSALLPVGCPNYRNAFQTELNTMGFPLTTRNIAIANGAGNGTMTGTPGMEVMNHTFNVTTTQRAIINLNFTPLANTNLEVSHFRGQQSIFGFWITGYESASTSRSPSFTNGLDSAPGGRFDMNSLSSAATGNAILTEFLANLQIQYFDFIPTLSSMAISNVNNLYSNVTSSSITPFAAYSIPSVNENHITLNPDNVAFVLNEILNPALATQNNVIFSGVSIQNPIQNEIKIHTDYEINGASVSITDILGKTIYSLNNQNINGNFEIPISLSNGVYVLSISNELGSVTKKLIKE